MRIPTAQADALAVEVLTDYRAGLISERETRERLATLVCRTEIHRAVAFDQGTRHLTHSFREDLASENLMLLTRLMLSGAANGFDLNSTGSLCGWARNLLYASRPRKIRDLAAKEYNQLGELRCDESLEIAVQEQADFIEHWSSNGSAESTLSDAEATEAAVKQIRVRRRESERIEEGASMLTAKFGLVRPLRPLLLADRDAILRAISRDQSAAYESLSAWLDIENGTGASVTSHTDRILLSMWETQTKDSAASLLDLSPTSVNVLVRAACQRRPRPSQKAIASLRGRVSKLALVEQARWRRITGALVEAWIASEYEATSAHAPKPAEALQAQEAGHAIYSRRLDDVLDQARSHPANPLGAVTSEVLANLRAEATAVFRG